MKPALAVHSAWVRTGCIVTWIDLLGALQTGLPTAAWSTVCLVGTQSSASSATCCMPAAFAPMNQHRLASPACRSVQAGAHLLLQHGAGAVQLRGQLVQRDRGGLQQQRLHILLQGPKQLAQLPNLHTG